VRGRFNGGPGFNGNRDHLTQRQIDLIAAMAYPRVRPIVTSADVSDVSLAINLLVSAEEADRLLADALSGTSRAAHTIPVALPKRPVRDEPAHRVLALDFCGWRSLAKAMGCTSALFNTSTADTLARAAADAGAFETAAFQVLGHLFDLFTGGPPNRRRLDTRAALQSLRSSRASWLPRHAAAADGVDLMVKQDDCMGHYYPFTGTGSHDKALAGKLNPRVLEGVCSCVSNKRWFFMHCGGNAPIDFILLYVTDQRRLRVWMSDAKHMQTGSAATVSVDDMRRMAQMVFASMNRNLKTESDVTAALSAARLELDDVFDPVKDFWIFTNEEPLTGDGFISPTKLIQPWAIYLCPAAAGRHGLGPAPSADVPTRVPAAAPAPRLLR